jgi:hypothetical protein
MMETQKSTTIAAKQLRREIYDLVCYEGWTGEDFVAYMGEAEVLGLIKEAEERRAKDAVEAEEIVARVTAESDLRFAHCLFGYEKMEDDAPVLWKPEDGRQALDDLYHEKAKFLERCGDDESLIELTDSYDLLVEQYLEE